MSRGNRHGTERRPLPGGAFEAAVGVPGEAALLAGVNRIVGWPGPPAELGALVVQERLLQLRPRAHHEGSVLGHRLADGPALQEEELARFGSVLEIDGGVRPQLDAVVGSDGPISGAQGASLEEVERAVA